MHLDIFHDKSHTIIESIDDVKTTIIIALILVVLVIYLFLGRFSDTVIPSVTLPLSLVVTFIFMYASKFSLDNLSLMGLTLSIGFVVDDAIVVLENTVRLIEEGKKPLEAAIESAKEISGTVVSMTLSLAVIFVPLVFMGGVIGRTFREFAITVVLAIMVSGVISLTLSPMMCARMLKEKTKGARQTPLETWMNNLMKGVIDGYGKWLRWTLKRPMTTLVSWVLCLAGTGWLFTALPKSFLPEGDSGLVQGLMIAPLGISSQRMNDFQSRLNGILLNNPNIEKLVTLSGLNAGADQSTGPFFAVLKPASKRKPMQEVVRMLRTQVYPITQGFVAIQAIPSLKVSTGGESTAQGNKYSYVITGADQDEVYRAGLGLEAKLRSLKGFVDLQNSVKLDLPQLTLTIKRDRASTLGITAQDIESVLSLSFAQGKVTLFKTDIDQYDVIVELDKHFQSWPSDLGKIYLRSRTTDAMVPLSAVAIWKEEVGPQNVPHFNQLNSATISFNLESGIPLGTATKMLEDAATKILPPGVTGQLQGEAEEFTAAIASLGFLILVAVFIKYIILGVLYESYTHPFTVLTTLPVATFGG
ncbi:MAG: efflux RND transporter permease subunit, partial [Candidatus Omnitrophota bacterium]